MNQAMGTDNAPTFESDVAKDAYIDHLTTEIEQLEVNAKFAKAFTEMYESTNFQTVMLKGLLGTHIEEKAIMLVDPYITEELENEILFELKALRYLNKFITGHRASANNAERQVIDNKQLLLDTQLAQIED